MGWGQACPDLHQLYGVREYLLALMYKVDADGAGTVTLREMGTVRAVVVVIVRHVAIVVVTL